MNRSYRLIWSQVRQAFVVADEGARSSGKSSISGARLVALAGALFVASSPAMAAVKHCGDQLTFINDVRMGPTCALNQNNAAVLVNNGGGLVVSDTNHSAVWVDALSGAVEGVTIENAGRIESTTNSAIGIGQPSGNPIQVRHIMNMGGDILGNTDAIWIGGNTAVTVGSIENAGRVEGREGALAISGNPDTPTSIGSIVNYAGGVMQGGDFGVGAWGYQDNLVAIGSLENAGTIKGNDGIDLRLVTIGASILNTGRIDAKNTGLTLRELTLKGDLTNRGSISGADGGISVNKSMVAGALNNTGGIESDDSALHVKGSTIVAGINNSGSILTKDDASVVLLDSTVSGLSNSGKISGLAGVASESGSLGFIDNSGTIEGQLNSVWLDGSGATAINAVGDQARFIGDVKAIDASFNVKSGSTFRNEGAIQVAAFNIERGATFLMEEGRSTTRGKDNGIGFEVANDGITVGSGGFNNQGTLALGATSFGSILGNYEQSADGRLKVGVADDQTFGKLLIDGTATLPTNARIEVDVTRPDHAFGVTGMQDIVMARNLVSDGTFAVSDNSLLFNFGAVKNGNSVDLTLTAAAVPVKPVVPPKPVDPVTPDKPVVPVTPDKPVVPVTPDKPVIPVTPPKPDDNLTAEHIVRQMGNSPAYAAARALDQTFAQNPTGDLAANFVGLSTRQQVSEAVTQTLPLLTGSSIGATGSTLSGINRVIQARQDSGRVGLSSGDAPSQENLWIKTFGSWADQDERSGVSGFDANTQGLAIGADAAVSEQARMGVAFAYAKTDVDSHSNIAPQSMQIDTFQLIGYGSYTVAPGTELNVQLDVGQNNNKGKRHMSFADATAKADYTSHNAHAGVSLDHTLRLNDTLTFQPSVRADYTWIADESYREKGADALNLKVDSRDAEALVLGVDGKLDYNVSDSTVLSASAGVGYDVINEQASITSTYAGAPGAAFTTQGLDPSPWLGRAGLGLNHTLDNGTEVSLRYDVETRSAFSNQGVSLKARWAF